MVMWMNREPLEWELRKDEDFVFSAVLSKAKTKIVTVHPSS
jgi:hypothetical protein